MSTLSAWLRSEYTEQISAVEDRSLALAIGLFEAHGDAVYLNAGMRQFLGGEHPVHPPHQYFVNPTFADLTHPDVEGLLFDGIATLGDGIAQSYSFFTKAWRHAGHILVIAEPDVLELDRLNTALSRTNQQINNLQRELLKKNQRLEATLAELRETQAMLIHAERMNTLGQLVAGVAHEINNPLSFVIANIYNLKDEAGAIASGYRRLEQRLHELGEHELIERNAEELDLRFALLDIDDLMRACQDGLERIRNIVGDLRKFSRLHQAERSTIDLAESLNNTLTLAKPQLANKDIVVEIDLNDLPVIDCWPAELNQVFMNLIVNAAQAMDQGGKLTIHGRLVDADWVELRFKDTGCGIPAAILDRIFDPFFTTKSTSDNTGLGLAIAEKIITERHRGRITVDSREGEGSEFTLRLPKTLPPA